MDELNDNIKNAAENFSLEPSSGLWEKVQSGIQRQRRKRIILWWSFMAVGVMAGAILFGIMNFQQPNIIKGKIASRPAVSKLPMHESTESVNKGKAIVATNSNMERSGVPQQRTNEKGGLMNTGIPVSYVSQATVNPGSPEIVNTSGKKADIPVQVELTDIQNKADQTAPINEIRTTGVMTDSVSPEQVLDPDLKAKTDSLDKYLNALQTVHDLTIPGSKQWSILLRVTPAYGLPGFREKGDYRFVSAYRKSTDKVIQTWDLHCEISYTPDPVFEFYTGLGMISYTETMLRKQAVYHYDTNWITGPLPVVTASQAFVNIAGDSTGRVTNTFKYLEIPLRLAYSILPARKFGLSLQVEITADRLIRGEGFVYNHQQLNYEKMKSSDLKKWLMYYGFGLSFQAWRSRAFSFEISPFYRISPMSVYSAQSQLSQHFEQAELRFMLRYHFQNGQ